MNGNDVSPGQRVVGASGRVISPPFRHVDFGIIVWVQLDGHDSPSIMSVSALREEE